MNSSTRVMRRRRRTWSRAARSAAAIIATVGLALPVAASGSSPTSTVADRSSNARASANFRSTSSRLLAFSRCMRSHGVHNFPDPEPNANNAKSPTARQLGVSSSELSAAEKACEHLLPAGIDDQFPPAEVHLLVIGMLSFSQCMRSHGVSNWPDPTTDSAGRPVFLLSAHGFTREQTRSPQITHTMGECQHLLPRALGGIPTG